MTFSTIHETWGLLCGVCVEESYMDIHEFPYPLFETMSPRFVRVRSKLYRTVCGICLTHVVFFVSLSVYVCIRMRMSGFERLINSIHQLLTELFAN